MASEMFWACRLSKDTKEYKLTDLADDSAKILLKKVMLENPTGAESAVEITTDLYNDDSFKFNTWRLNKDRPEQTWDLMFPAEKTTFKLVEGEGPIVLIGSVVLGYDAPFEVDSDDSDIGEEEEEDESVDEDENEAEAMDASVEDLRKKLNSKNRQPGQKSKLAKNGNAKNTKKAKLDETNNDDDSEDDDEDEDDEDEEPPVKSKPSATVAKKGTSPKPNGNQNKQKQKAGKFSKKVK